MVNKRGLLLRVVVEGRGVFCIKGPGYLLLFQDTLAV